MIIEPQISIIIPAYNCSKYISQTLDSIINQTVENWECIIIDDGSTDNSGEICDIYAKKDPRFKIIHQTNHGVSFSRNKGISLANGEIISFVDSDDWIESDYCEQILTGIDGVDEVIFPIKLITHDGDSIQQPPIIGSFYGKEEIEKVISTIHINNTADYFGWTANKAHRKSIIKKSGACFPENLNYFEDEVFALQYYKHINSLRIISKPIYNYRYSEEGLSNQRHSPNTYSTAASYLENNLIGYVNPELNDSFCHQIFDFYRQAELTEQRKSHRKKYMLKARHYYRTHINVLKIFHINRKTKLIYSLPLFLAVPLYLILNKK